VQDDVGPVQIQAVTGPHRDDQDAVRGHPGEPEVRRQREDPGQDATTLRAAASPKTPTAVCITLISGLTLKISTSYWGACAPWGEVDVDEKFPGTKKTQNSQHKVNHGDDQDGQQHGSTRSCVGINRAVT
jgi:hypothetical protein